ncbi:MAG: TIGR04255 family protein [Rhodospirillales bacterium]|nr:TIGR04255 family protein [Rhodospirillales bacterium]
MAYKPLHDTHAIERVSFALGLERELSEREIRALGEGHKGFGLDFGRAEFLEGVQMKVSSPGGGEQPAANVDRSILGGVRLKTYRRDGSVEWEMATGKAIDAATIAVNCSSYTRWGAIWGKARDILAATLKAIGEPGIKWAGLEYQDVFIWEGEDSDWRADHLFNLDSSLLSKAVLERGPIWHTHHGWFSEKGLSTPGHRLELLNVDSNRREGQLKVQIISRFTHYFREVLGVNHIVEDDGKVAIAMEQMHEADKDLLGKLLTPEIIETIYLHAEVE